jgi:molybdenum cofactor biosynthesis protein B
MGHEGEEHGGHGHEGCGCGHGGGGGGGGCCGGGGKGGGCGCSHGEGKEAHGHAHGGHGHAHAHAHEEEEEGEGHEGHGCGGGCQSHSPAAEHKREAPVQVAAFVVTCSDSRDAAQDETGELIRTALEWEGHTVTGFRLIKDEPEQILKAVEDAAGAGVRALIFNGGTGIGRRDSTVETLRKLFDKELPGFGELFRIMSFQEIGSPAMMSRAVAGTCRGMIVFALPGSPQAARLAMEELILPELGHAVRELSR